MDKNFNLDELIKGCGEYTNVESLFFADIIIRSGEVYNAEITHSTEYDSSGRAGATYLAATIERPQEIEEEINLGKYLKCRDLSYNGITRWIIIE